VARGCGGVVLSRAVSRATLDGQVASPERQIRDGADGYAEIIDQATRTSVRARVLAALDDLELARDAELRVARVPPLRLQADAVLRGAILLHLDLVFRSSVSAQELAFTAERGLVMVAEHPQLDGFPVAVVLAAGVDALQERRAALFEPARRAFPDVDVIMPFALAASPSGLGAGRVLLAELVRSCGRLPKPPRVTTFSPMTGLRAHVIRCVDEPTQWGRVAERADDLDVRALQEQLLGLLEHENQPARIPEPARTWLQREALVFASADGYGVGKFHRSMGAQLAGVLEAADRADSDALWWRAWFDYGRARAGFGQG
jgi:hypothetical protein